MQKIIWALVMVIGLAACGEKQKETDAVSEKPVVKIGVIVPLTGEVANVGAGLKYATEIAREDLSKRGLKNSYEFIYEDDGFEAKKTVSAFNKLSNIDGVNAVISFSTQAGGVIGPMAEKSKIIQINVGASEAKVAAGKYNFVHWTLPSSTTRKLLDFYQKNNYKKVVMAIPYNSGALAIEQAFKDNLANYPEIELKMFYFQPNEKDFRMLMSQIKAEKPDVVLTLAYGNTAYPFLKQYRDAGFSVPLTNAETFAMLSDFSVTEGYYFSDVAVSKEDIVMRMKQKYPDSGTFAVGNTYDAIIMIVEAFEKAQKPEQAVEELKKIKSYEGMVGHLEQDDNGIFNSQAVMKKVVNGQPVVIEEEK